MISIDELSYRNRHRDGLAKFKLDSDSISNFWFYSLCERQTFVIYHKNSFLYSVFNFWTFKFFLFAYRQFESLRGNVYLAFCICFIKLKNDQTRLIAMHFVSLFKSTLSRFIDMYRATFKTSYACAGSCYG